MNDPREALAQLFAEHRAEPAMNSIGCSCASERWDRFAGYAAHVAELVAREFLVVPRSDIERVEYGYRHRLPASGEWCSHLAANAEEAAAFARSVGDAGMARETETWERPVLRGTPIRPEVPPDAG